jgi:hypothetical protein
MFDGGIQKALNLIHIDIPTRENARKQFVYAVALRN